MSESYIQFPLCALAYGSNETIRLDRILSFGFVNAGKSMWQKLDDDEREDIAEAFEEDCKTPNDFSKHDVEHVAAMIGARNVAVSPSSLERSLANWKILDDFRLKFEAKNGTDALVRVKTDLVFEARDKKGITYREFAIFCAMLSSIGSKAFPVRITREQIQYRMLGYKSKSVLASEKNSRQDGASSLTIRKIGYTLDKLHERRFFARARANERQTYYSIRHTQDELESALFEIKTKNTRFHEDRQARNRTLMERIRTVNNVFNNVLKRTSYYSGQCFEHRHQACSRMCSRMCSL